MISVYLLLDFVHILDRYGERSTPRIRCVCGRVVRMAYLPALHQSVFRSDFRIDEAENKDCAQFSRHAKVWPRASVKRI